MGNYIVPLNVPGLKTILVYENVISVVGITLPIREVTPFFRLLYGKELDDPKDNDSIYADTGRRNT